MTSVLFQFAPITFMVKNVTTCVGTVKITVCVTKGLAGVLMDAKPNGRERSVMVGFLTYAKRKSCVNGYSSKEHENISVYVKDIFR